MGKYKKTLVYNDYIVAEVAIVSYDSIEVKPYNLNRRQGFLTLSYNLKDEIKDMYLKRYSSAKNDGDSIIIKTSTPEEDFDVVFNMLESDSRYKEYIEDIEKRFGEWYKNVRKQNNGIRE